MVRFLGALLIVAGVLALVYKGVTVPREKKEAQIGPIEFSMQKKERYEIPTWVGVAAVGAGAVLLYAGSRK
jgi:hypothetical protein